MNSINKALDSHKRGNNCAQAILESYCSHVDISPELAIKLGSGLGGGVGRSQSICGAVNAGAIILGLKHSNGVSGDTESKEKSNQIVGEFVKECELKLGSIQCKELLKINLSDPNERLAAKESGLFDRVCNNAIEQTARILEKHL